MFLTIKEKEIFGKITANKIKFQFRIDNIMSKAKKQSLPGTSSIGGGDTQEILCYKPKDLVW